MKKKEIIAYRNGSGWEVNSDGYVYQLPWYVKTKGDVRKHFANGNDNPNITIKVIFAK